MIIRLPHVGKIDTLNLPDDFEELVKRSFGEFTKGTRREYMFEDKLMYLDNLRKSYLRSGKPPYEIVRNLILESVEYELDEYGELPTKEDFWDMDFMADCVEAGQVGYRDKYEKSTGDNEKTLKVILDIIRIVSCYEE